MKVRIIIAVLLVAVVTALDVRAGDKAENDSAFFALLCSDAPVTKWKKELKVDPSKMEATKEAGIMIQRGSYFQVRSLRDDVYLKAKEDGSYELINSYSYPLETIVNLLLGYIEDNSHYMFVSHHQYGKKLTRVLIPMRKMYDLLCPTMDVYCSVTAIDAVDAKAVVVFHDKSADYIHMLEVTTSPTMIGDPKSTIFAELYTNIPQSTVKTLFGERTK